jgi:transcriptional regulator with XRE-family HTH domain
MSIGTRLKQARKAAQLTQIELAAKSGLKQSTISDLEKGKSSGSTSVAALAQALGVSALWLETGRGEASAPGPTLVRSKKREARMILAYDDEEELLDLYRRSSERWREEIRSVAAEGGAAGDSIADNQ